MSNHDDNLAQAFDGQAADFERAPVQTDPALLQQLLRFADLPPGAFVLDAGCGPGLVSEALLRAKHRVLGVDLSGAMIERARKRCAKFPQAEFVQQSLFDPLPAGPFSAAISRFVLHHTPDPDAFVRRQGELLRPGGAIVVCDHVTDPDPQRAAWHQEMQRARDRTHTHDLTPGELVDLFARAGLVDIRYGEETFVLDFDEWFDRGTPAAPKDDVRRQMLAGPGARGFLVTETGHGAMRIDCRLACVRGVLA